MESAVAKCVSNKEIFQGTPVKKFQYVFKYDYKAGQGLDEFDIVLKDDGLEHVWSVKCTYVSVPMDNGEEVSFCLWNSMTLKKSERKISGNILIERRKAPLSFYKFDPNSKSINFNCINCSQNESMTLTIRINHEEEKVPASIVEYYKVFSGKVGRCDVTFVVKNTEIKAHRLILKARSEVFNKMFDSEMPEKKTMRLEVTNVEPDDFKLLLNYIYTGLLDTNDPKKLNKLIFTAHSYGVKNLVGDRGYQLANNNNDDNNNNNNNNNN